MGNSNTFSRDVRAAKSNKGVAKPKDKIIGNSSTEDWLNDFDDDLSMMGYRDDSPYRERSSIDIHTPNGMIDMSATGIPLMANGQYLPPYSGIHDMGTPYVTEERIARYGGIPRAQNGFNKRLPDVQYNKRKGSQYDPITETVYIDPSDTGDTNKLLDHELWHHYQNSNDWFRTPEDFPTMRKPQTPATNDEFQNYYNRNLTEISQLGEGFKNRYPEFNFAPNDLIYNRVLNDVQYQEPWTMEGESRAAESDEGLNFLADQGYDVNEYLDLLNQVKTNNPIPNLTNQKYGGGLHQYRPGGTPFGPPPKSKTKFPTGPGRYRSNQGYIDADKVSQNSVWFNPEAAIEEYLGYPQTQGSNASEIVNGPPIDNIRHSVASYKTAKAIADKTKPYLGNNLGKVAGVIGSNALGLAHEIERFPNQMDQVFKRGRPIGNTLQENIQDLYNNAFGSFQVFNGMTSDGTTEYLKQQSKKGNLAKGYVDDNAYNGNPVLPKQERVLNDNTRVVRRDGGDLKKYQGDVDGSEVVNLSNQFIYPSAFQYAANTPLQNRAKECQGPDCLAGANTYYNKYVASKFGLPTSWKMLDDYGIVSGDASKPYGVSMDSWDAAAEMQAKGAIQNYAAPLYEADKKTRKDQAAATKYWKSKTDEEKRNIYSQLALGTLVNFGDWGGVHGERLQGSNEKAGLYPSRHSTRVIGFTEDGTPMIYDMGQIRRIDDPRFDFPITNITTPKELAKYNYQYVKDWETTNNKKLNYNPKENLILAKGSQRAGEDAFTDEEFKYVEGINKNIKNLMSVTGASQEDIIKAGKVAFGIMQGETRGGRGKPKAKLKEFVKNFMPFSEEASQGLTRIKPEMQAGDETNKYSQYLKSLGLDPKNLDLWDPEQAAIATTALILSRKGDMEGVDKWYLRAQQHNTPSVGLKNEQRLKEADKDYADNIIKNTSRLYSTNTGYGLSETEKWMAKQKAEASKKRGEKAWSETFKVKPAVSESTGYAPRVIPISQLAKKEMGGESGWLDEHDLPKAQDGFNNYTQPGPLATGDPRDSFGFTFPTPVEEQVIETKKPVKKQDIVKGKQQTFFPEPGKNYNDILTSTPTYPSSKEQNTIISMSDERRAYEQNLANEKADRQLNAIQGGLNVAGLFYYPAAVAASALEFSEGNYGQSAAGLIPFVGPASRANTARNILNQASRNLLTKSYNAGIPYKIAAPIIKGAKKTTMYGANAVNAQDAYDVFTDLDEQKYGGVKKYKGLPKGTTKNVVRGINKLFAPDPKLFGPFGRKAFDPNSKFAEGGESEEFPSPYLFNHKPDNFNFKPFGLNLSQLHMPTGLGMMDPVAPGHHVPVNPGFQQRYNIQDGQMVFQKPEDYFTGAKQFDGTRPNDAYAKLNVRSDRDGITSNTNIEEGHGAHNLSGLLGYDRNGLNAGATYDFASDRRADLSGRLGYNGQNARIGVGAGRTGNIIANNLNLGYKGINFNASTEEDITDVKNRGLKGITEDLDLSYNKKDFTGALHYDRNPESDARTVTLEHDGKKVIVSQRRPIDGDPTWSLDQSISRTPNRNYNFNSHFDYDNKGNLKNINSGLGIGDYGLGFDYNSDPDNPKWGIQASQRNEGKPFSFNANYEQSPLQKISSLRGDIGIGLGNNRINAGLTTTTKPGEFNPETEEEKIMRDYEGRLGFRTPKANFNFGYEHNQGLNPRYTGQADFNINPNFNFGLKGSYSKQDPFPELGFNLTKRFEYGGWLDEYQTKGEVLPVSEKDKPFEKQHLAAQKQKAIATEAYLKAVAEDRMRQPLNDTRPGNGTRFGDLRSTQDNTRVVKYIPNLPKKPLTKTQQEAAGIYSVKTAENNLDKAQKEASKFERIKAANKAQAQQGFPTTRQEWADQTQAIGPKLSLQNIPGIGQYVPNILDVTGGIGDMASSLASAPLRAQQEDSYMPYVKALAAPLFQGAFAGMGTTNTGQFLNNAFNPFAGLSVKGLRRKPASNAEFDPNHYEFSNPEMTDYFNQQPKRDLAEARIYEKKAAEEEQWLQQAERDRQDALASQYSDDELENGIEIFGDSDDPFGDYSRAVNVNTPANVPNFRQGLRDYLQTRDTPNIQPLNITPPSSIPPPPTYEQYIDNASYIGTTPLSREQYEYINNTPTPSLQSTPQAYEEYLNSTTDAIPFSRQEYDAMQGVTPTVTSQSVFPTDASGWPAPGATPNVQPVPQLSFFGGIDAARRAYHFAARAGQRLPPNGNQIRLLEQHGYGNAADYVEAPTSTWGTPSWNPQTNQAASQGSGMNRSPVPNAATNTTPQNYTQADIDEARRVFWDTSRDYQTLTNEQAAILQKHGNGDPPLPPDAWTEITENLKQNKESVDILSDIKKQLEKDKNVTGRVNYSDVANTTNQTLIDKSAIPSSDNLDSLIKGFEKVIANTPQNHQLRQKLVTQLEDLKATKWLREEYTKEIKTKGGKAKENLSIVSSNPESSYSLKHLVDQDGNILGSVDINSQGYVGSSGLAHKYHGVNLDRLNLENTDAAQTFLEQRLLKRNEEAFKNSVDRGMYSQNDFETYKAGDYFEKAAKREASKIMKRLIENNDNKFGEALYRGIHHGIKDTKGGLKSAKHFVETTLENPISGVDETARRGKLGWNSWTRQDKAIDEMGPNGYEQFRMIRSLFPYLGAGYLGSKALEEQKYGGWLDSYK